MAVPVASDPFFIGRQEDCHLVLPLQDVSRRHLRIERGPGGHVFFDLGSTLGVKRNGGFVTEGPLRDGDLLEIGTVRLRFRAVPELVEDAGGRGANPSPTSSDAGDIEPFLRLIERLKGAHEPKGMVDALLKGMLDALPAERGFVLLRERGSRALVPVAVARIDEVDEFLGVSSTITERAMAGRETVVVLDSAVDPALSASASVSPDGSSRTVVCEPLLAGERCLGAIYLDLPFEGRILGEDRLRLLRAVTSLTADLLSSHGLRGRLLAAQEQIAGLRSLTVGESSLLLGSGEAGSSLDEALTAAAAVDVNVLISGETGTGKEMVARELHRRSKRAAGPFVAVHCAALPKDIIEAELFGVERGAYTGATEKRLGRFELASGGTLFLDEMGELDPKLQVKLLRVLQERRLMRLGGAEEIPLDFRLVCATNVDLEDAVRRGAFRSDLYFRINVFRLPLRPLRERPEEIEPLALHFLGRLSSEMGKAVRGFSEEALCSLRAHPWPGNVRELRNAVERALVVEKESVIRKESLPLGDGGLDALPSSERDLEAVRRLLPVLFDDAEELFLRVFVERALERSEGNVAAAARASGMTRNAIYRRLDRLGLNRRG